MNESNEALPMHELIERLEAVCRKLWDEDRVNAVGLQAVANELKIALQQNERVTQSLHERVHATKRDCAMQYEAKLATLNDQLTYYMAQTAAHQEELVKAKAHIEALLGQVEAKEEESVRFREKYLKLESDKELARTEKLDELIEEIGAKDRKREEHWKQRHHALESEFTQRQLELEATHKTLLDEIRNRADQMEEAYRQKESKLTEIQKQFQKAFHDQEARLRDQQLKVLGDTEALAARSVQLERDYAQKRAEVETLKQNLKAEVEGLTRRYRPDGAQEKEKPEAP